MREIWDTRFGHAILKVERAKKHISDADQRIITAANAYHATTHFDLKTGKQFLYYAPSDKNARREIALITGDAIHNLRSALDIAWMAILERDFPHAFDPDYNKFPFKENRQALESALKNSRKINPSTNLFRFMVDEVQPYIGGDPDMVALHYLDIDDKHRLLIPVSNIAAITSIELQNESGDIDIMDVPITHSHLPERVEIPFGSKVKDYGKVALSVAFGEGNLLQFTELVPTLYQIYDRVQTTVNELQRMR
jgi:hypothetical protein